MTDATVRGRPGLAAALEGLGDISERLSELSIRSYRNPYAALTAWPDALDPAASWYTAPELLSCAGTESFDALDGPARRRLSFYEAANFYSLNIHGEKGLMQGLAKRLYRRDLLPVADYLHHFLDEENKHSIYFGAFCTRYARVYRSRQVAIEQGGPRDLEDFLFFAKTLVFEQIVDQFNRLQARDRRLHDVARFINGNHHAEETRHLAFGRRLVEALWQTCADGWGEPTVDEVRRYLAQFFVASWREYYNPDMYKDAGLADPYAVAETNWRHPAQRRMRRELSRRCLRFLLSTGILDKEPSDAF